MKKPNITPGDWNFGLALENHPDCGFRIHTPESAAYGMAHLYSPGANVEANARAIAALPKCLAVLERILYASEVPSGASFGEAKLCQQFKDQARAALLAAGYTE